MTIKTRPSTMFSMSSLSGGDTISIPNPDKDSAMGIISTLVDSGRNSEGVVVAQKIGRDQGKTELKWSILTKNEWEAMVRFWHNNFFFNFTYYDDISGTKITRKFYVGDRSRRPLEITEQGIPVAYVDCSADVVDTGSGT
jgi:hypothetical protein